MMLLLICKQLVFIILFFVLKYILKLIINNWKEKFYILSLYNKKFI